MSINLALYWITNSAIQMMARELLHSAPTSGNKGLKLVVGLKIYWLYSSRLKLQTLEFTNLKLVSPFINMQTGTYLTWTPVLQWYRLCTLALSQLHIKLYGWLDCRVCTGSYTHRLIVLTISALAVTQIWPVHCWSFIATQHQPTSSI